MKKFVTTRIVSAALFGIGAAGLCLTTGTSEAKTKSTASKPAQTSAKQAEATQAQATQAEATQAEAKQIRWLFSLDKAVEESQWTGKPILADFYADWCPPCQLMKKQTFPDAKVIAESQRWVMVKIDVDKNPELAARYGITSLPTIAVLNSTGKPVNGAMGYLSAAELVKMMRQTYQQATTPETNSTATKQ